ncbi:MAG: FecR family protein [Steroidobacteraceae bacterium]
MDRLLQAQFEDDPVLKEAAEWFFEMRSDDVTGERIAEWQQWLSNTANRDAFGRVEVLWRLLDGATVQWPTEAEVTADGYSGAESITAWRLRNERPSGAVNRARRGLQWDWRNLRTAIAGVAAAAAIAIVVAAYWPAFIVILQGGSRMTLATGVGETRTIRLPDGSIISAGADTELVATLLKGSRTVVLGNGEAYFRVVKNPRRPFTVRAGDTTVTDIGTAFDVRRTGDGVIVAVAEGVVDVATHPPRDHIGAIEGFASSMERPSVMPIQLTAGERLALESSLPQLSSVKPDWVGAWREGHLQYVDEPLNGVVADLARYSERRIVIADPALAKLRVTGVVYVKNIDGWLASLQATFPVRVVRETGGTTTIEQR